MNFSISSILPSGVIIYQYDLILDSDSNAVDVFSLDESLEKTLELSARGCPLTYMLNAFVQPNGACVTSIPIDNFSISFKILRAVPGDVSIELKCAYG